MSTLSDSFVYPSINSESKMAKYQGEIGFASVFGYLTIPRHDTRDLAPKIAFFLGDERDEWLEADLETWPR